MFFIYRSIRIYAKKCHRHIQVLFNKTFAMFTVKSTAVITYVQSYEVISERFYLIQNIKTNYI